MKPRIKKLVLPTHLHLKASQHANSFFSLPNFLSEWTTLATTILLPYPLLSSSKVAYALTALKKNLMSWKILEISNDQLVSTEQKSSIHLKVTHSIFENVGLNSLF